MKYFKEEVINCYTYCPFNNYGKDVATGYQFIPCSSKERETCTFLNDNITLRKEVK